MLYNFSPSIGTEATLIVPQEERFGHNFVMYLNMTKRFLSFVFIAFLAVTMIAQESSDRPQRTPEEEALKQTTRLVRELGISDSIRFDTIYRMHLKYARWRQTGLTRAENMKRMQSIHAELERLLTPKEFELFMNHPSEMPHRTVGTQMITPAIQPQPTDSLSPSQR